MSTLFPNIPMSSTTRPHVLRITRRNYARPHALQPNSNTVITHLIHSDRHTSNANPASISSDATPSPRLLSNPQFARSLACLNHFDSCTSRKSTTGARKNAACRRGTARARLRCHILPVRNIIFHPEICQPGTTCQFTGGKKKNWHHTVHCPVKRSARSAHDHRKTVNGGTGPLRTIKRGISTLVR